MNLLVCVKQVPDTTEIKIDPVTNTLIRAGVPSILNPFDGYALEVAARLKDTHPDSKIVVATMGPAQAKEALKHCLSTAADAAYLISDRAFGGSDTLATSYILSKAIGLIEEKEGPFDVILCGKQAIDGDTAQVGPEIAEHLDLPQVTYAVEASEQDGRLRVKKETETGYDVLEVGMPCLITVTKPAFELRNPTIKRKLAVGKADIPTLTSEDFEIDLTRAGLKGSPTKVKKTFTPSLKKTGEKLDGSDPRQAAVALLDMLREAKVM